MKTSLQVLDAIQIADPCPVSWDSMTGTERMRHCSQCKQDVFDLSAMSADEAAQLINDSGSSICVRFYRRTDGRVVTRDCAAILALRRLRNVIYRAALAIASFLGIAFASSGCTEKPCRSGPTMGAMMMPTQGKPAPPSELNEPAPGPGPAVKGN
jgi:hypothetical protein